MLPETVDQNVGSHVVAVSLLFLGLMAVSKVSTESLQKVWEGPCWEGMWPFFCGSLGCCGDCSRQPAAGTVEVRATWRALLLPHKRRSWGHPQGGGRTLGALFLGGRGILCHVRIAHDGRDVLLTRLQLGSMRSTQEPLSRRRGAWSGGLAHLFLEDRELARVALSCHPASEILCQENARRLAVGGTTANSSRSIASQTQNSLFLHRRTSS